MKLNAFNLLLAMAQTHDHAFRSGRGNLQRLWQTLLLDNQRVIATCGERLLQTLKDRLTVVIDFGRFAVAEFARAHDAATEYLRDGLMTQAHAENRDLAG